MKASISLTQDLSFPLKFIEEANVFFVKKTGGAQIMEG